MGKEVVTQAGKTRAGTPGYLVCKKLWCRRGALGMMNAVEQRDSMKVRAPIWALMLSTSGCLPLVFPINYRSIHGTVGYHMSALFTAPCDSPEITVPALVQEGGLPPGIVLQPDGKLGGTPLAAGRWHAMVRLPRYQCQGRIVPDRDAAVHFDILELTTNP